jgi:hypothetical protein
MTQKVQTTWPLLLLKVVLHIKIQTTCPSQQGPIQRLFCLFTLVLSVILTSYELPRKLHESCGRISY